MGFGKKLTLSQEGKKWVLFLWKHCVGALICFLRGKILIIPLQKHNIRQNLA